MNINKLLRKADKLVNMRRVTAGFEHPTKNASSMLPSGDRKSDTPTKHIRADTQTEVNLKKEDDLKKVYYVKGHPLPEKVDVGKPHPTDPNLIGHQDKLGNAVWSHTPDLRDKHAANIIGNFDKVNMTPKGKSNLLLLAKHIAGDPDNGVMASGTTSGHVGDFSEPRLRHISSAMSGRSGYKMSEGEDGSVNITAPRHSSGKKSGSNSTTWNFNGKKLKSFHKNPIGDITSQGEYDIDGTTKLRKNDRKPMARVRMGDGGSGAVDNGNGPNSGSGGSERLHLGKWADGKIREITGNNGRTNGNALEKEEPIKLTHYSKTKGLSETDPEYMGSGTHSPESAGGAPETKRTFFYRSGSEPEPSVIGSAPYKYVAEMHPDHKLYDISKDKAGIYQKLKAKANKSNINPGLVNSEDYIKAVKDAGYHGYYNSEHPALSDVVALFGKQKVDPDLGKSTKAKLHGGDKYHKVLNIHPPVIGSGDETSSYKLEGHGIAKEREIEDFKTLEKLEKFFDWPDVNVPDEDFGSHDRGFEHVSSNPIDGTKLHHHIFVNRDDDDEEYRHIISKHPESNKQGVAEVHVDHFPVSGSEIKYSAVHPDEKGKGYGRVAYHEAIKHHGSVSSDDRLTSASNKVYQRLAEHPHFEVELAEPNSPDRHKVKYIGK